MKKVKPWHELTKKQLTEIVAEAYAYAAKITDGKNAEYIPYLADVPSDLFGITLCLTDGTIISVGDTAYLFGIESVSKIPTTILVLIQHGPDALLQKIGADATGLPFNSIMAMLLENSLPSTPLVNAGAISACSMIEPKGDKEKKWEAIVHLIEDLCNSKVEVIEPLFESEMATNWHNQAMTALLKASDRIYDDPKTSLELYTKQCSLGISCEDLAVMGATIANKGINPISKKVVFAPELSTKIIALMASVGFYEDTGQWIYTAGIPAKSGVGGGIMGVLPGKFGIAAFSPLLDKAGNSVKAQAAIRYLMERLNLHIFDTEKA